MNTDHHGLPGISEPMWTPTYCFGLWLGGLQNRLRGAVEASWVGSIPIHPRQTWCRENVRKRQPASVTGCSAGAYVRVSDPRGSSAILGLSAISVDFLA